MVKTDEPEGSLASSASIASSSKQEHPVGLVPWVWLVLGLVLPTLVTWIYFDALSSFPPWMQQLAYGLGKASQFALPLVVIAVWGQWWRGMIPWWKLEESAEGSSAASKALEGWDRLARPVGAIAVGLAIGCLMLVVYRFWLLPNGVVETARVEGEAKLHALGMKSPWGLLGLAAFYSLLHSGLEEWYWRGFVFAGWKGRIGTQASLVVSSLGFMSHHVLVLAKFFGWMSIWTVITSAGVAIGGAIWAWMLWRSRRLLPGWISHAIVDAAIFAIAWHLIFVAPNA
jgi:membrane protease YdiL (CAAX protease family)